MLPQRQTFQLITNYLQSSTTLTTMSALLSQHPAAHLDHKIDLSSLGITIIDILETFPVQSIKTIDLSNNRISTLCNLRQFTNAVSINLTRNIISDGQQLLVLRELKCLKVLLVQGNLFLEQPLPEDVLQVLLEYQNDIEVLSGRVGSVNKHQMAPALLYDQGRNIYFHQQSVERDELRQRWSHNYSRFRQNHARSENIPNYETVELKDLNVSLDMSQLPVHCRNNDVLLTCKTHRQIKELITQRQIAESIRQRQIAELIPESYEGVIKRQCNIKSLVLGIKRLLEAGSVCSMNRSCKEMGEMDQLVLQNEGKRTLEAHLSENYVLEIGFKDGLFNFSPVRVKQEISVGSENGLAFGQMPEHEETSENEQYYQKHIQNERRKGNELQDDEDNQNKQLKYRVSRAQPQTLQWKQSNRGEATLKNNLFIIQKQGTIVPKLRQRELCQSEQITLMNTNQFQQTEPALLSRGEHQIDNLETRREQSNPQINITLLRKFKETKNESEKSQGKWLPKRRDMGNVKKRSVWASFENMGQINNSQLKTDSKIALTLQRIDSSLKRVSPANQSYSGEPVESQVQLENAQRSKQNHMIDNFNQPDFCKDRPRQTMSYQPQSPEQIEASFHRTLSLRNPIYNLLLSPFESLSKAEMHQLLQAMSQDYKEKWIELMRERQMKQSFSDELKIQKGIHEQLNQLVWQNRRTIAGLEKATDKLGYLEEINRQNESEVKKCTARLHELQQAYNRQNVLLQTSESKVCRISKQYQMISQKLEQFQTEENMSERIRTQWLQRLKAKYWKLLQWRATKWHNFYSLRALRTDNVNRELLKGCWNGLIFNIQQQKALKLLEKNKNNRLLSQFVNFLVQNKEITKELESIVKMRRLKSGVLLMCVLQQNEVKRKMNKLRKIWAVRHYNVKSMKKALTFWKLINDSNAKLEMSVQGIYAARLLKTHFRFLATAVNIRRQRESIVTQFHITGQILRNKKKFILNLWKQTRLLIIKNQKIGERRRKYALKVFFQRCALMKSNEQKFLTNRKLLNKKMISSSLIRLIQNVNNSKAKGKVLKRFLQRSHNSIRINLLFLQRNQYRLDSQHKTRSMKEFLTIFRQQKNHKQVFAKKKTQIERVLAHHLALKILIFFKNLQISALRHKFCKQMWRIREVQKQYGTAEVNRINLITIYQQQAAAKLANQQFLKSQINEQMLREQLLLCEKDEIVRNFDQSYNVMTAMKQQLLTLGGDYDELQRKHDELRAKYQHCLQLFDRQAELNRYQIASIGIESALNRTNPYAFQ